MKKDLAVTNLSKFKRGIKIQEKRSYVCNSGRIIGMKQQCNEYSQAPAFQFRFRKCLSISLELLPLQVEEFMLHFYIFNVNCIKNT